MSYGYGIGYILNHSFPNIHQKYVGLLAETRGTSRVCMLALDTKKNQLLHTTAFHPLNHLNLNCSSL